MTNFIVYATTASGREIRIGAFEFRDQAIDCIDRFLSIQPTATCYINDETVGWVAS